MPQRSHRPLYAPNMRRHLLSGQGPAGMPGNQVNSSLRQRAAARSTDRGAVQVGAVLAIIPCIFLVIVLLLLLITAVTAADDSGTCGSSAPVQPQASKDAEKSIPANFLGLYRAAGHNYGIPWNLLAAIGKVETGHGTSHLPGVQSGENYAGAGGPMQFVQGTWNQYGVDGNDDGKKDRYDPADAIPGAANYLRASGAPTRIRKAIFAYNHSWDYVNMVSAWAKRYAANDFVVTVANNSGTQCSVSVDTPAGPTGKRIVAYAMQWLRTPYLWGGGNHSGPTGRACAHGKCGRGFDCSGLTMYAVAQATGGKVKLSHYTGTQQTDRHGKRVSRSEIQPGDLVFFTSSPGSDPHHVGIYIGRGKMVHAPHTGDWVKVSDITKGTYQREFSGATRFAAPGETPR